MFDIEDAGIPQGLDEMPAGPVLAATLTTIDVSTLSGRDRVVVLRAHQRLASHYTAHVFADMAAISDFMHEVDDDPVLAEEAAAAEIRVALRLTRRAADDELGRAHDLSRRLPSVWDALATGAIDPRRVRTILHGTEHLPVETARRVVDEIIEDAPRLTGGQLAARIRRLCIESSPRDAARRYEDAVTQRRVVGEPTGSGTGNLLGLDLPPEGVAAATRRIAYLARRLRTREETRTIDQLKADVFLDLLCGTGPPAGRGVVDIHVDLPTLAGLAEHPGELGGYGPVIADIARRVADEQPDTEWRYTVIHPDDGRPIGGGTTRRRPTNGQRRETTAHHPTCIFPGCRMPATGCDLDHRIPVADGGSTLTTNLAPLCRHDHRIRHQAGWRHRPLPNGDHQWTSRLGQIHTTSGAPP
jgi:hypothetical protein